MTPSLEDLRGYVDTIADDGRDLQSLGGTILHYGVFLRKILNAGRAGFMRQRDIHSPTTVASGAAIAPWHAAACMEDRTRTAVFIRGAIRAVAHVLDTCPVRPLHLVEAGCGPLGTLVLPLLARFSEDELVVSLIDLHQESIACMETMLDHFGFLPRTRQLICGDATTASLASEVHIILTETMNTALGEEPQVEITRALVRQHRDAFLIPQSIGVRLALLDLATELSHFPPQVCNRTDLGPVFELNRETAATLVEENGMLPAASIRLPGQMAPGFVPCVTTGIQVFEEIRTGDYETQITHPVPLQQDGMPELPPGSGIRFSYRLGPAPGLTWQRLNP